MTQQLTLVAPTGSWKMTDETREIGLRGVAAARATLETARRNQIDAENADLSHAA